MGRVFLREGPDGLSGATEILFADTELSPLSGVEGAAKGGKKIEVESPTEGRAQMA